LKYFISMLDLKTSFYVIINIRSRFSFSFSQNPKYIFKFNKRLNFFKEIKKKKIVSSKEMH